MACYAGSCFALVAALLKVKTFFFCTALSNNRTFHFLDPGTNILTMIDGPTLRGSAAVTQQE